MPTQQPAPLHRLMRRYTTDPNTTDPSTTDPSCRPPSETIRKLFRLLIPAALGFALAVGVMVAPALSPLPAHAATVGRMVSIGGWQIGAFLSSNGEYVYCIEPGAVEPSSNQKTAKTVSSLPGYSGGTFDPTGWRGTVTSGGLSGAQLRQINYVLWNHGRTSDAGTAAAVQLAVWMLRADPGAQAWLDHHLGWVRNHGGGSYIDHANTLVRQARANAVPPVAPEPESPVIEWDEAARFAPLSSDAPRIETGRVRYAEGTAQISIEGATFSNGKRSLAVDPGSAGIEEWNATMHETGWRGLHEIEVEAEWEASGTVWPAKVRVLPPMVPGQQRLAAGVGPEAANFSGSTRASALINSQFTPVLSTLVSEKFVPLGKAFTDTVTLSVADPLIPWPTRSANPGEVEFAPVIAKGKVFGPFDSPQQVSTEPPSTAEVAAEATLVAEDGPGEYAVEADNAVAQPGYYYWVWRVSENEQLPDVREGELIPAGYRFSDDFGLAAEGQVSPSALQWSTRLESQKLRLDDLVLRDRITVRAGDGAWLRDESESFVPARIRLTVYESATEPQRQSSVPSRAKEVAREFVEVSEPGVEISAEPIVLPASTRGWVTLRACLFEEDQPEEWRGYTEEWCDDYGMPAETAHIEDPELLSRTGSSGAPVGAPLAGLGLIGTGAGVLLIGGMIRQFGRKRNV